MIVEVFFKYFLYFTAVNIICYFYKEIHRLTFNYKHDLILIFCVSWAAMIFFEWGYSNIFLIGMFSFLSFFIVLCLMKCKEYLQIIYYSLFITTVLFYIYMLIGISSRAQQLIIIRFNFSYYLISLYITIILLCITIYMFKLNFYLPDGKISLIILFITVLILIMELLIFDRMQLNFKNIYNYIFIVIIGLIFFSNNIIIQYLYNDFHQLTIISQNNLLSKITDSYIQGIHNEQEKVFKIRHDIKNNLIILQHLINSNQIVEANQVIDEINNHLKYKKSEVYTGNIFIDAYLSNIINNSQIEIQINCNDLEDLHYKPDVIAIIINLVDNAVENADHLIIIQIKHKNPNSILIKVSNDSESDPSKNLKKSKKQGDHGYGLRIVIDVVNQYQGTYITSYQNGMFTTYIKLNLEEKDES